MKKKLNIMTFASPLHDQRGLFGEKREALNFLKSQYDVTFIDGRSKDVPKIPYVLFIGTGGTEGQLLERLSGLTEPLAIISDSYHNSLAASLEISSKLFNEKVCHKHINFPVRPSDEVKAGFLNSIELICEIQRANDSIRGVRIGLIGGESEWLIASGIDRAHAEKKYGVKFIDITIERVIELYQKSTESAVPDDFRSKLSADRKEEELLKAYKMYRVLEGICKAEQLTAITIKCFDLLKPCDTTACLALSLLNDEGVVSGCEGDIPTLWSMIVAKHLCGSTSFMANPSAIDRNDRSIDFAHCTVPVSLGKGFTLPSHYESRMGIAVAAEMKLGDYTLFKCGGRELDRYYAFEGEIVQNTSVVERCRTQIKFRFNSDKEVDEFLQSHLGNHVVLIPRKHAEVIKEFFRDRG